MRDTKYPIPGGRKLEIIFNKDTLVEPSAETVELAPEEIKIVTLEELLNECENKDIISFYAVVVKIGEYVQRISRAGNAYAIRELFVIDDSCDTQLTCTLWDEQAFNYIDRVNEVVFFKNTTVNATSFGPTKVSLSRSATIMHGLLDKRAKQLQNWMLEQTNSQAGIDTPLIKI